jgi:CRP/FNR family transcriptional regulator
VAHETISRSFGTLVAQRLVWVENREVEILDMERLRVFASGTRRAMDDTGRPGAPRTGGAQHTRHVLAPSRGAVCTAELVH